MKYKIPLLLAVGALALAGCTRRYVITTHNGTQVTTSSKPKLQQGVYIFKDASGKKAYVPAGRVREVSPASMVSEDKTRFNPSTSK